MNSEFLRQIKSTLVTACQSAGEVLMSHFGNLKEIGHKGEVDLITAADNEAEQAAIQVIRADFPSHGILAEESGDGGQADAETRWIIDPLDGTTNFAHTLPMFTVSIGVEHQGRMVMAMVHGPALGDTWFAERGQGATLNGRPIHVSRVESFRQALAVTGFPYDRYERPDYYLRYVAEIMRQAQGIRRTGCASLDLCSVACGRFDVYWEENLWPWDMAAGWLVIEEAGGKVTDFSGQPYWLHSRQIAASNGLLHEQLVEILRVIWEENRTA